MATALHLQALLPSRMAPMAAVTQQKLKLFSSTFIPTSFAKPGVAASFSVLVGGIGRGGRGGGGGWGLQSRTFSTTRVTCMSLRSGIVGLPNVGKSTLFNALVENAKAQAANYPFCTIEPNVGVVAVPDPRLDVLSQLSHSQRVVPTSVEFVDIAGLVKGASQGEVFFLLSCFYLLQNLSTQMDIPFVSSFLHLCFFLLQIDFNGDIFFFFFMMVICLFYAML
jgi:hypothetical protein